MIDNIKKGNLRTIARAISEIENETELGKELLALLENENKSAFVIGVTGPPGAGKSTLMNRLAVTLSDRGAKVGVIAVDPSSPITGGALLGDRIRMTDLSCRKGVYVRSMSTRGALGGISNAVEGTIQILNAAAMDYILLETVGVGQSEVDVKRVADLILFVTVPGLGDDIQAEKAGVMEIADIVVLNKGDRDDADDAVRYLQSALRMSEFQDHKKVPLIKTEAVTGVGVEDLFTEIMRRIGEVSYGSF